VTTAQVVEVTPDRLDKAVRRGNVDRAFPSTRIFFFSFSSSTFHLHSTLLPNYLRYASVEHPSVGATTGTICGRAHPETMKKSPASRIRRGWPEQFDSVDESKRALVLRGKSREQKSPLLNDLDTDGVDLDVFRVCHLQASENPGDG